MIGIGIVIGLGIYEIGRQIYWIRIRRYQKRAQKRRFGGVIP